MILYKFYYKNISLTAPSIKRHVLSTFAVTVIIMLFFFTTHSVFHPT